ncbi:hypothetical protein MC885_020248, partial [Smutsia gigantea]
GSHVCDQQEDETTQNPGDPQPPGPCRQGRSFWDYCSLRDAGHPQDLLKLQCGQGCAEAAEGHCMPSPFLDLGDHKAGGYAEQSGQRAKAASLSSLPGAHPRGPAEVPEGSSLRNLEKVGVAPLQPTAHVDTQELRTALKVPGEKAKPSASALRHPNDAPLSQSAFPMSCSTQVLLRMLPSEILATQTPPPLQECLAVCKHNSQVEAEEDIESETGGTLQELLLALACWGGTLHHLEKGGHESYSDIIDYNLAEQYVQALKQAEGSAERQRGSCSLHQRNTERLVGASVIRNTPLFFADKLHQALQVRGPPPVAPFGNLAQFPSPNVRPYLSRSETDLLSIRAEFKKKFGKSLYSSVQVRLG